MYGPEDVENILWLAATFNDFDIETEAEESFQKFFSRMMDYRKISKKRLSTLTGIPERTIGRMRTEEGYRPRVEYIVICCIALHLKPWESEHLLYLAGIVLRSMVKNEAVYNTLIHRFYLSNIEYCNLILSLCGVNTFSEMLDHNKDIRT